MGRNKLYVLLSTACGAGYIWLLINFNKVVVHSGEPGVCLFKRITSIPCPSCGSTRSVLSIVNGDIATAIYWNPFGLIIMAILIISPFWLIYDVLLKRDTLFHAYNRTEIILRRKWIAILLILLVILNWIWNIYKGL
jgi:hypothetical protein